MFAIKDDIQRHGFIGTIAVQKYNKAMKKQNVIINGEHRYTALVELGAKLIPCNVLDIDDKTSRLLTLRLNREHGELQLDRVTNLLESLQQDMDLNILADLTAMPVQELEMLTRLELADEKDLLKPADTVELTDPYAQTERRTVVTSEDASKPIEYEPFNKEDAKKPLYLSWGNVEDLVKRLAHKILAKKKEYQLIVAVANGGLIPARLLARELGTELFIDIVRPNRVADIRGKSLVVDDIFDTWETISKVNSESKRDAYALIAKELKYTLDLGFEHEVGYLITKSNPNYARWIVFPWEKGIEDKRN